MAPDSCIPFKVWTSVAREGREASLSVPPPVSAPQPSMCEAALTPPSMPQRADHGRRRPRGHQSPCRCARSAGHRQGALAQGGQSSARFHGRRRLGSRGRHLRRRSEAFGCFRLRHLLRGEPLDVLRRLALHLRRPLPRSLQQGLHFAGPSDDLRGAPRRGAAPVGVWGCAACGPASRRRPAAHSWSGYSPRRSSSRPQRRRRRPQSPSPPLGCRRAGLPESGAWAGPASRCAGPGRDRCARRRCRAGRTASSLGGRGLRGPHRSLRRRSRRQPPGSALCGAEASR